MKTENKAKVQVWYPRDLVGFVEDVEKPDKEKNEFVVKIRMLEGHFSPRPGEFVQIIEGPKSNEN